MLLLKKISGDDIIKILNFGSSNIDFVYSLEHIVSEGESLKSTNMNIFPGGKGLNQSVALARAGADVFHAGCFGTDGEMLINILKENNVDVSYIKSVDEKNGHAIIQVTEDGENAIFIYQGSNAMITENYADNVLSHFGSGDFLLLQNEINNIEYIIKKAFKRGMKIVLNPSPCSNNLKNIDFNMLSFIILNEGEIKTLSGCDIIENAIEYFRKKYPNVIIVLTLGKNGSILCDSTTETFQQSFVVNTVDTTAAGDTYTGYFIAMVSKGESFKNALRISSAASALAVSKNGAAPSIPHYKEVFEQLKVLKENPSSKNDMLKEKINKYIDEHINDVSIKDIAELLNHSDSYTQTLIKKLYGKSISKIIQSKKCSIAAKMLEETELSVSEIINTLGYENESFFRKCFKEKYNKNMLEYRNYIRSQIK